LIVERLRTTHPGDDDNIYFLGDDHEPDRIQIDTLPGGRPPFLIEAADQRHETSDPTEATNVITAWLRDQPTWRPR
jgi:hypothetical protein